MHFSLCHLHWITKYRWHFTESLFGKLFIGSNQPIVFDMWFVHSLFVFCFCFAIYSAYDFVVSNVRRDSIFIHKLWKRQKQRQRKRELQQFFWKQPLVRCLVVVFFLQKCMPRNSKRSYFMRILHDEQFNARFVLLFTHSISIN